MSKRLSVAAVVLLLFVAGGYFYYQHQKAAAKEQVTEVVIPWVKAELKARTGHEWEIAYEDLGLEGFDPTLTGLSAKALPQGDASLTVQKTLLTDVVTGADGKLEKASGRLEGVVAHYGPLEKNVDRLEFDGLEVKDDGRRLALDRLFVNRAQGLMKGLTAPEGDGEKPKGVAKGGLEQFDLKGLALDLEGGLTLASAGFQNLTADFAESESGPSAFGMTAAKCSLQDISIPDLKHPQAYTGKSEMTGLAVSVEGSEYLKADKVESSARREGEAILATSHLSGGLIQVAEGEEKAKLDKLLKTLGKSSAGFEIGADSNWTPQGGGLKGAWWLDIMQGATRLELAFDFSGLPPYLDFNPEAMDEAALEKTMGNIRLAGVSLVCKDGGMLDAILGQQAAEGGQKPEQYKQGLMLAANMMLAGEGSPFDKEDAQALGKFIMQPGRLELALKPPRPMNMDELSAAAQGGKYPWLSLTYSEK